MFPHETNLKLIRFSDLVQLGIVRNRMTLYRWIDRGHFPAPIKIGPNAVAWRVSQIQAWLEDREALTGPQLAESRTQ